MAKILQALTFIFLLTHSDIWAQSNSDNNIRQNQRYHYLLVNSYNPKRYFRLKDPVLDLVTGSSDPKYKNYKDHHFGWIDSLDDSNLYFHVTGESIESQTKNGYISNTSTKFSKVSDSAYWDRDMYNSFTFRTIKIQSINYLKYRRDDLNGVDKAYGTYLTCMGSIATLLIAPLASINYKNGEFNAKKYYGWVTSGLITVAIGVPLLVHGNGSKYKIANKNKTRTRNYWYFDRKLVN